MQRMWKVGVKLNTKKDTYQALSEKQKIDRQSITCPKCYHFGPPVVVRKIIPGAGNKKTTKCAKCQETISIEDFCPNKAETTPNAPKLL